MLKINKIQLAFLFVFLQILQLSAQSSNSILERLISANFKNTPLKEALTTVAQKGHFEFSYGGRIIEAEKKITLIINNLSVRETLILMLGYDYSYQQKGEYLIVKKSKNAQKYISGYISDAKTGKKLPNTTIYDSKTLRSTTTNENGYYTLKVQPRATIVVAKLAYHDSLLQVTETTPRFLKINLDIQTQARQSEKNSSNWSKLPNQLSRIFISPLHRINNLNVNDSIHRVFQLSLIPYIGTNHAMSGIVTNDYSINMIAGYARGNRVLELSGVGSFINENTSGIQAAGVFNIVKGNAKGLQMGGVFNHVNDTLKGVQLGGVWNYAKTAYSINQSAGVANIAQNGNLKTQFAGVANLSDTIAGAQIGGVYNHVKTVKGVQIAGVMNQAKEFNGVQLAGVVNHTKYIKGVQIGLVNYADSLDGLQIGLFNYAKKGGYNMVELSANEISNVNLAYKSGGRKFYTTFVAGITPKTNSNIWTHGAGIGTLIKLREKTDVNIEALYRHVNVGLYSDYVQEWLQLGVYGDFKLGNRIALSFGPSINALLIDSTKPTAIENIDKIFPSYIKPRVYNADNAIKNYGWIGGKLALQINI